MHYPFWNQFPPHRNYHVLTEHFMRYCLRKQGIKNYIALGDDSLIKTAVEYYGDKKKSVRAAKAHYYWGATYGEKGYTSFAVDEYLTAIRLMPVRDEFLAMIYDNLADCYEKR